uniref:C-type lectin domain-containing protein n=1 Tax=Oncorhynchus mykiss TaxID=8022 RepID=A0A8K9VCR8_ONCMY
RLGYVSISFAHRETEMFSHSSFVTKIPIHRDFKILPLFAGETTNKSTFIFIDEPIKAFSEAQSYCREYHTDLASVRNQTENQEIQKMVSKGSKVWIGLFRDSWKWSDGSDSSFRYWNHTQPNNNGGVQSCGAAVFKGGKSWTERWFDWNCKDRHPFVCYSGELL